jgi:two-component system sensor histidine kinase CpxA
VRSLFLKIFLWFWVAMALVSITLILSELFSDSRASQERDDAVDRTMTPLIADNLVEIYDTQGKAGLAAFISRTESSFPGTPYLFDSRGGEALGRHVSPETQQAYALAPSNGQTEIIHRGNTRWVAQIMTANSGHKYVFVLQVNPHYGPTPFIHAPSQVQVLRVLAILLIVGLISLVITRHITSPILRLRLVANQLAQGNLAARVGSDSMQRKDELAELSKDFDHMAAQIQTLMASQQRLLSDISHELRSPLARLSVALGLARRSASLETASALNRIERETQRLNELIAGLLQLARMESGSEKIPREVVNLDLLLKDVAADANFEARSRNRGVRVAVNTPCQVQGNPELLRSAIENVVRNAINYTPENTEVVATLTCEDNASSAVVRVCDQGPGVPESALANIFQPFYRVEAARDRSTGGTGLGLSITDRAIRGHGGSVQAQNVPGSGLQIELHLPVAHSATQP